MKIQKMTEGFLKVKVFINFDLSLVETIQAMNFA